jgi:hypothetical protein
VELEELALATATTDWISAVGAILALVFAAVGVVYAGGQLRASRRATEGQFLLALEDQLHRHAKVHVALLPGGIWTQGRGPRTIEEWAEVVGYLGLFERMNALRRDGTLSLSDIERFYSYRLINAWANAAIRRKVEQSPEGWKELIELYRLLDLR